MMRKNLVTLVDCQIGPLYPAELELMKLIELWRKAKLRGKKPKSGE